MRLVFRGSKLGDFNVTEVTKVLGEGIGYWVLTGTIGVYVKGEEFTGGPEVNFLGKINSRLDYILKIERKNASDFSFSFRTIDGSVHTVDVKNVIDLNIEGIQWVYFSVYIDKTDNEIHSNIHNITANLYDYSVLILDNIDNLMNTIEGVKVNFSIDSLMQSGFDFCNINNAYIGINEVLGKDLSFIDRDEKYYSSLIKVDGASIEPVKLLEALGYSPVEVLKKWFGVEAFEGQDFVDTLIDMLSGLGYKVFKAGAETEHVDAVGVYKDKESVLSTIGGVIENENRVYVEASFSKSEDLLKLEKDLKAVISILRWFYLSEIKNINKYVDYLNVDKNYLRALITYKVYERG